MTQKTTTDKNDLLQGLDLNEKVLDKLKKIQSRFNEICKELEKPDNYKDHKFLEKLNKEKVQLQKPNNLFNQYKKMLKQISDTKDLINSETDKELKQLAQDELKDSDKEKLSIILELNTILVERDPNDSKDVFLEIRAGTGGDEAAIFAGDLNKMYTRYSEKHSWDIEIINSTESDHGGFKEIMLKISGDDVYGNLKFESGVHRVQRVPETETQGRVHTSAATVAVLPVIEEIDEIEINPSDLRIDTYRASGAGGQHVNKTDSAVRITHLPTGTVAECQDGRSQHKNKAQAMEMLYSRLLIEKQDKQRQETAEERKSLIGSGDRSERIRTYNFPQGRLTDHRINLTLYKLDSIMEGNIESVVDELRKFNDQNDK
tara:strand:- start:95 stop:1216 length:1122 start_codon:yes stop_codon:yes gene_type:complete